MITKFSLGVNPSNSGQFHAESVSHTLLKVNSVLQPNPFSVDVNSSPIRTRPILPPATVFLYTFLKRIPFKLHFPTCVREIGHFHGVIIKKRGALVKPLL